jgi:hypothetical protein
VVAGALAGVADVADVAMLVALEDAATVVIDLRGTPQKTDSS